MTQEHLREVLEQPHNVEWWGSTHEARPRLIEYVDGDGRALLAVQPLNTRPHYYVVRIDSARLLQDDLDDFVDHLLSEIELETTRCGDECGQDCAGMHRAGGPWPGLSLDSGWVTFWLEWPSGAAPTLNHDMTGTR